MRLKDKNGIEINNGDIVIISGGYFKNSNGLHKVKHTPGDEGWGGNWYRLIKINKDGTPKNGKYNLESWPLISYTTSREKSRLQMEHDRVNAQIEIIRDPKWKTMDKNFSIEIDCNPNAEVGVARLYQNTVTQKYWVWFETHRGWQRHIVPDKLVEEFLHSKEIIDGIKIKGNWNIIIYGQLY